MQHRRRLAIYQASKRASFTGRSSAPQNVKNVDLKKCRLKSCFRRHFYRSRNCFNLSSSKTSGKFPHLPPTKRESAHCIFLPKQDFHPHRPLPARTRIHPERFECIAHFVAQAAIFTKHQGQFHPRFLICQFAHAKALDAAESWSIWEKQCLRGR